MPNTPLTSPRPIIDYDPRGHGHGIVPFITSWTAEHFTHPDVVLRPDGAGIGYRTETLGDRDTHGILWYRYSSHIGQGKPRFGDVHTTRQRIAMRHLLCQVCAQPADEDNGGVLWLLPNPRIQEPGWPDGVDVTEPPICRPCVEASTRLCPRLREGHTLFRAASFDITGVHGMHYLPALPTALAVGRRYAYFDEPVTAWICAWHLTRTLRGCTTTTT